MREQQSCDGCVTLSRLLIGMEADRDRERESARVAVAAAERAVESYEHLRAQTGGLAEENRRLHQRLAEVPLDCADAVDAHAATVDAEQTGYVRDVLALAARIVRGVSSR